MNPITPAVLHDLGINKSETDEAALVEHFQEALNERVGANVIDVLDDVQVTHLLELTEQGDVDAMVAWLQETVPEYDQIVRNEYEILLGELAESAEKI